MNFVKPNGSDPIKQHDLDPHTVPEPTAFTLAHLSDIHLPAPGSVRMGDLLNKRVYGYLSWRLHRGAEHNNKVLSALLEDLKITRPDHMVITGDLTHLGLPREFIEARDLLRFLGPPSTVTVIPGNHDAYVATPWERTFRHWSDYMSSDADSDCTESREDLRHVFPILRLRKGIALIGVSTARPTPLFSAMGRIGKMQIEKLEHILAATRHNGLFRIIAIHHPPVPGAISWRKRLTDLDVFQTLLARQGAELILHGHTHRTFFGHLETPMGRIPSIGVPSASALGRTAQRRARYHLFHLIQKADGPELLLSVRAYSPTRNQFFPESQQRLTLPQPQNP
jgi:3',5'-cyclic AMP phosphodiesterase CpdA